MQKDYLPISREDMERRGWEQCDFVYVSGDAYVDHPSFGTAIISRVLESRGFKVGIIAQGIGAIREACRFWGGPGWDFWYPREIWILW